MEVEWRFTHLIATTSFKIKLTGNKDRLLGVKKLGRNIIITKQDEKLDKQQSPTPKTWKFPKIYGWSSHNQTEKRINNKWSSYHSCWFRWVRNTSQTKPQMWEILFQISLHCNLFWSISAFWTILVNFGPSQPKFLFEEKKNKKTKDQRSLVIFFLKYMQSPLPHANYEIIACHIMSLGLRMHVQLHFITNT